VLPSKQEDLPDQELHLVHTQIKGHFLAALSCAHLALAQAALVQGF
jgi:hypothetical protein